MTGQWFADEHILVARDQILDTAAATFAELGYYRATTDEIAGRVGIPPVELTEHFATTAELLVALLERRDADEAEQVRILDQPGGIQLLHALKHMVRGNLARRDLIVLDTVVGGECVLADHPAKRWAVTRTRWLRSLFAGALRRDMDAGLIRADVDPVAIASQIAAVMHGLQPQWLIDPTEVNMADVFDDFVDRLIAHLSPSRS